MTDRAEHDVTMRALDVEIAVVCGIMNAATARLVRLIAEALQTEAWHGFGIRSASQWVAWKCGVSPARARALVRMAERREELSETAAAFDAGELCEDQVAVIARHAPASADTEAAALARSATVVQLRRVLGSYPFVEKETAERPAPAEPRSVSFGTTDVGRWRLSAELPAEEGALVERALVAARDELFRAGEQVDWADAFVAMAERSLGGAVRPHHERHLVLLHVGTDGKGHLHLGAGVSDGMRHFLGCDARIRPVLEAGGRPVSVARAFRTVPDRTRIVIEERDRGCRVPGCERSRWLHVHHIKHWENGGTTDTHNLIALCHRHHRLHHLGKLGIAGNADDASGVHFTDERGRTLDPSGRPVVPLQALPAPAGERLDPKWISFNERAS